MSTTIPSLSDLQTSKANTSLDNVTGVLEEINGGTGQSTYTLGDTLYSDSSNNLAKLSGNTTSTKKFYSQTGTGSVSAAPSWQQVSGSDITGGAALSKTDDTNVTLTLSGSPSAALLTAVTLVLGWTGVLSSARGGTGVNNGSSTLTLAGNLVTSGAFSSTLTMTGTTNVTFPTSGTLATLGGNTFTATQVVTPVALTPGSTVATNAALSNNFTLTLGQNTTLSNPTNMSNGGIYTWTITQDSTPRTLTFGSKFAWNGGVAMTISTGSGAVDKFAGQYDSVRDKIDCWVVTQASS